MRHVDFLRRTVRVEQQLMTLGNADPVVAPPKTEASVRTVPLPQYVVDELAAHLSAYPAAAGETMFRDHRGQPISRTWFSAAVMAAGDRGCRLPTGVGMHALRHFHASLLIRHGESVKVVQARLGHASAVETLNTYSHLWPDSDDRTREAIDAVLGDLADSPRTAAVVD